MVLGDHDRAPAPSEPAVVRRRPRSTTSFPRARAGPTRSIIFSHFASRTTPRKPGATAPGRGRGGRIPTTLRRVDRRQVLRVLPRFFGRGESEVGGGSGERRSLRTRFLKDRKGPDHAWQDAKGNLVESFCGQPRQAADRARQRAARERDPRLAGSPRRDRPRVVG